MSSHPYGLATDERMLPQALKEAEHGASRDFGDSPAGRP